MSRKLSLILGILVIISGTVLFTALFTVHQTQQAIVLMLGNPKRVITEPGLQFKLPWVENVLYYEKRVLNLDPPVERVLLSDQKRLLVDAFARYRITDALAFYQAVRTEGGVRQRLGPIINAALRGVLGKLNLASVLSEERDEIMAEIQAQVNTQAERFGIELVDVRIRRADLPDEISDQVYQRMRSEREREAAEFRARGFEQAQRIMATADREATVIRAEAKREAEILRGQGEGKRTQILNDAYGQDQDFFNFYRSMQAYEAALSGDSTYMVLSPDSEFFDFFGTVTSGGGGAGN
ncbi:MAG: protease modulator HflC [Rhodospirillales bacterium]|nr:protease modulator HflC [Rhodospirillales bacterium]MDH3913812.1 protease modulator HflC [Rhodospirillales bacterium]MDH3921144.1 protease modulator HflC [Rhodospirillales bacterium]MDH3969633.1 protease modulator HflC [Rhodospirillales bacterium]